MMHLQTNCFCLLGVLFLLATACIDPVEVDVPGSNVRKPVIQGSIKLGAPSLIEVSLHRSADFISYYNAAPIEGAAVHIEDQGGNRLQIPQEKPGFYRLNWTNDGQFDIVRGGAYRLLVQLADGKVYESEYEQIRAVPRADSIEVRTEVRQELNETENIIDVAYIQFLIDTPLQHPDETERAYLKWEFEGAFKLIELLSPAPLPPPQKTCYISEKIRLDVVSIFNGHEATSPRLQQFQILEEPVNWNYYRAYYLTVYQQSLSREAYTYWSQVKEVTARTGSLFEAPPGKVITNLHNPSNPEEEVLGFFYVTEVDTIRRLIRPEEAGTPRGFCEVFTYEEAEDFCRNCLLYPNSSLQKPAYWK